MPHFAVTSFTLSYYLGLRRTVVRVTGKDMQHVATPHGVWDMCILSQPYWMS